MVYEWREYEVAPSKMPAVHEHFEKYIVPLFKKHGLKVVGFWTTVVGTSNMLYYLLSFDNLAHRENAWKALRSDPDYQKESARFSKEGVVVQRVRNTILEPTPYSPSK